MEHTLSDNQRPEIVAFKNLFPLLLMILSVVFLIIKLVD
jgi:hypothetical protein